MLIRFRSFDSPARLSSLGLQVLFSRASFIPKSFKDIERVGFALKTQISLEQAITTAIFYVLVREPAPGSVSSDVLLREASRARTALINLVISCLVWVYS